MIGGLTVGYDFVNAGFVGYAYPDWMKYFGFAMDYTYNRAVIRSQFRLDYRQWSRYKRQHTVLRTGEPELMVMCPPWTFLFYGHYGFFPDSEVPSGRLHPYVGVGPAVVWTGIDSQGFRG